MSDTTGSQQPTPEGESVKDFRIFHEPGRLAAFSDAVVAVAMTALVLPLLDIDMSKYQTVGELWNAYGSQFSAFLLSFFVIAVIWVIHHKLWFYVKEVNGPLVWINMGWLFGIILIPFGSVATYDGDEYPALGYQIYAGIMMFTMIFMGLLTWLIRTNSTIGRGPLLKIPIWYTQRYTIWWGIVLIATILSPQQWGDILMSASGFVMVFLGFFQTRSLRQQAAKLKAQGMDPDL